MKADAKEIKLQIWEEIIGNCVKFEIKRDQVVVILRVYYQNMRIAYQLDSKEGIILRKIGRKLVGQRIAILRTDIAAKPIVVRVASKKNSIR